MYRPCRLPDSRQGILSGYAINHIPQINVRRLKILGLYAGMKDFNHAWVLVLVWGKLTVPGYRCRVRDINRVRL